MIVIDIFFFPNKTSRFKFFLPNHTIKLLLLLLLLLLASSLLLLLASLLLLSLLLLLLIRKLKVGEFESWMFPLELLGSAS